MEVKTAQINILETSTVTLTAGTENPSFPLYRLYDRDVGKIFKGQTPETTTVHIDQGASGNLAIDQLFVPAGHNLVGELLDIFWSDDDAAWTSATGGAWVQGDALLIDKSWSSITHRYWKFDITIPSAAPFFSELFLTNTYAWIRDPQKPSGALDNVFNAENITTIGGQDRFVTYGDSKRQRNYTVTGAAETQKTNILTLNNGWSGALPFWLLDHEGVWIYGKLVDPIDIVLRRFEIYDYDFNFLEVIA